MDYREYAPRPQLAPYVSLLWTLAGHACEIEGTPQPVLPDGHPELILHFGDAFARIGRNGCVERQPLALFAGQLTEQLILQPTGRIGVLGVRFRPFGATAVLAMPQHELTGLTIGLDELNPVLSRSLAELRSSTDDLELAVSRAQRILTRHLRLEPVDSRVRVAVETIQQSGGRVGMDALARQLSWTRRHLERRFLDHVGVPPKRLARITRFQQALRLLETVPLSRGVDAAAECGYADQSHFIREFRDLAGCSPSQHLLRQAELTGFFISDPSRAQAGSSRVS